MTHRAVVVDSALQSGAPSSAVDTAILIVLAVGLVGVGVLVRTGQLESCSPSSQGRCNHGSCG